MISNIRSIVKLILFLGILYLIFDEVKFPQQKLQQTKNNIASTKILELHVEENKSNNEEKFIAPILSVDRSLCSVNGESMIGNIQHGGWYICLDFFPNNNLRQNSDTIEQCIVYSFGLGADWSFDSKLEINGCEVHGFDPSGLNWRQGMHGNAYSSFNYQKDYPSQLGSKSKTGSRNFHNWGLGAADIALYPAGTIPQEWPGLGDPQLSQSNNEPWEIKSIQRIINDLNHSNKIISILKIDTEGSEWDALASFFNSKEMVEYILSGHVKQLLIEWHWDPDST
jgi:hypothetical protein